jgi:hypothetical protein
VVWIPIERRPGKNSSGSSNNSIGIADLAKKGKVNLLLLVVVVARKCDENVFVPPLLLLLLMFVTDDDVIAVTKNVSIITNTLFS